MVKNKKKIVILGSGFAAVECAKKLEKEFGNDPEMELVMIGEDNFLLFTPMLPQVASGMIETRHIVFPIRTICKKTKFYEGRIKNIDPHGKLVTLWGTRDKRSISIHYDFLVVALGSETNFFGMADVEKNAYTMKTLNDAVMLRNRVIDMLEQAENETDPILRKGMLNFVVVGGGYAGIETAGELLDLLFDATKHYSFSSLLITLASPTSNNLCLSPLIVRTPSVTSTDKSFFDNPGISAITPTLVSHS